MAITYDAPTKTITITGYTSGTPGTLTDIYNADVAGGWGVFTRQCTRQFCSTAKIVIGDGTTATYVADNNKQLTFADNIIAVNYEKLIYVMNNASLEFGILENATNKTTSRPINIIDQELSYNTVISNASSGVLNLYGGSMVSLHDLYVTIINDCHIYNYSFEYNTSFDDCEAIFNNVNIRNSGFAIFSPLDCTFNNINVTNCSYGVTPNSRADCTYKNITIEGGIYDIVPYFLDENMYMINVDCAWRVWNFAWDGGMIHRQYEFDLNVADSIGVAINSATVKIWDKDDTLVVDTTTDGNGDIITQTITRGVVLTGTSTLVEKAPHTIEIKKSGTDYLTYEAEFTIGEKTTWEIAMTDVSDIVDGINDIKGTGFVKDTDSMINITDNILDELIAGHTTVGSFGAAINDMKAEVTRTLGLSHENTYIDTPVYDIDNNLTSARLRLYSVAGSVGTDSDVIATYLITAPGDGIGKFTTWKQVKS